MRSLFFELGVEEIPARLCERARTTLGATVTKALEGLRLNVANLQTFATPRRLAFALDVDARQPDVTQEMTGPPARIAFDADGNPTKAAEAFARRNGIALDALTTVATPKGDYLAATVHQPGEEATALLPGVIQDALAGLQWPKLMRWGVGELSFIRPVHWIVAALDGACLPITFAGVSSGLESRGHRFMAPERFAVDGLASWLQGLRDRFVEPDPATRSALISRRANALAEEVGGTLVLDKGLLAELTYLAEWPVPLLGSFDEAFLQIPSQVLVTSMRSHQKYAAVARPDGSLSNHFILVAGLESTQADIVVQGNRRVLAARLADAGFFYETDRKRPLEDYIPNLESRVYLKGLGTMADKAKRLERLAATLATHLTDDETLIAAAREAGLLAKADLSTAMVGEFATLQGEMGREYALLQGASDAVADAIRDHYLPKHATDALPEAIPSVAVALADRLDHLVGCFALGNEPTGSADPYALRRKALGVLRILMESPSKTLTLPAALALAWETYDGRVDAAWEDVSKRLMVFLRGRLKNDLASNHPTDLTEAVLSAGFESPRATRGRLAALVEAKKAAEWDDLAIGVKRVVRIVADAEASASPPLALTHPAAIALQEAYLRVSDLVGAAIDAERFGHAVEGLVSLKPAIDRFFDEVMVMSEDLSERARRVDLLHAIGGLFGRFAAFDKVST